jgi:hypothetical protein
MKRFLLISLVVVGIISGFAIPVLAHGPGGGEAVPTSQDAWQAMWEACINGDWEAMAEAAEEIHGEASGHMPGHSYDAPEEGDKWPATRWSETGGHMGGGMMRWR